MAQYYQRRITIFLFFTLFTLSSSLYSIAEGKTDVPTTKPSNSLAIQEIVEKLRALSPSFKTIFAVEPNDSSVTCSVVVSLPEGLSCDDVKNALHMSDDYFDALNPNIDCDAVFTGQWICVLGYIS